MKKFSFISLLTGFILAFGFVISPIGCLENKTVPNDTHLPSPETIVTNVSDGLKKDAENLTKTTDGINSNAKEGQKQTPENVKPILDKYWINILGFVGAQEQLIQNLNEKSVLLENANTEIGILKNVIDTKNTTINEKEKTITKLNGSLTDSLRKNLHWLIAAGIIISTVGVVLLFTGSKFGIGLAMGGGVLTAISLFISQTAQLIPWIVGGAVLIFGGFQIYDLIKKRRQISTQAQQLSVQDKAVTQLVHHIEGLKPLLTTSGRIKMFGAGPLPPQFLFQDKETETIVKEKRLKMPSEKKAPSLSMAPSIDFNHFSQQPVDPNEQKFTAARSIPHTPIRTDIDMWTVTCADIGIN